MCSGRVNVEFVFVDTVDEFCSSNHFGDVLVASEFSPLLLSTLSQFEHHCHAGSGRAVAFGLAMPQADCGERAFDRIRRANVTPVLRRKVEEREQAVAIFAQAFGRSFVFRFECFSKRSKAISADSFVGAFQISCNIRFI